MSTHDQTSPDHGPETADTANFQQFMDASEPQAADSGRTFRLISMLVGVLALVGVMYLLLFT